MILISREIIIIVLAFSGFLLATYIHNKKTTKKRLICPRKSDCNNVINSDYSKVFGIPVEVLGMVYYAFIMCSYLLLAFLQFLLFDEYRVDVLFYISLGAAVFSLYLIFIQAFKIKQWCLWCIGSAIISLSICVLSFLNSFVF
jgi:uncharacterized membrane protein